MQQSTLSDRAARIRQRMRDHHVDLLLLVGPSHVTYVTGFLGQDSWAVVTARRTFLLTDSRYTEQARNECPAAQIVERMGSLARTAGTVAQQSRVRTMAVDRSISLADWDGVRRHLKARVRTVPDLVAQVRVVKEPPEIRCIRRAGSIARKVLTQALQELRPGVTENALAGLLDYHFRRLGAMPAFDTIVAFGPNASRPHHRPTTRKLRSRDTVLIDFGARVQGYCSDITRCFAVGEPPRGFLKGFDVVSRAQAAAIQAVRPGATLAEVDAAARNVIRESGLPMYGHGTGHGLGLDIHESPLLRPDAQGVLLAGSVLTVEPAVYVPGQWGIRLEDDVLVTASGCQILTRKGPHSLGGVPPSPPGVVGAGDWASSPSLNRPLRVS
jgi:Xaa-Pro aminopeptidase